MSGSARLNFVQQQGFPEVGASACAPRYAALMFQPRLVGLLVVIGLLLQAGPYFLALAALLYWNALVPAMNPFDALYNVAVAGPKRRPRLTPAPGPRRFAQGMAATFMLIIGVALLSGWWTTARIFEGFLVLALGALIFGRFCLGSYIFHLLTGNAAFAARTLPWARRAEGDRR